MDLLFFLSMVAASAALCSLSSFFKVRSSVLVQKRKKLCPGKASKVTIAASGFSSSPSEFEEEVVGFCHLRWGKDPFYGLFPALVLPC